MKRIILTLVAVVMIAALMTGCSKQSPESTVDSFFKALVKFDLTEMESYIYESNGELSQMDSTDSESTKFIKEEFKDNASKLTYKITGSSASGESGKVKVDVHFADESELFTQVFSEVMGEQMQKTLAGETVTDEQFEALLIEKLKEAKESAQEKFVDSSITVQCVWKDDKWYISQENDELMNVVMSNLLGTFQSIMQ